MKKSLPRTEEVFETGARYQMYHALAMILAGLLMARGAGWMFQAALRPAG